MLPEGRQWGHQLHCQTGRVISHVRVLGGGQKTSQKRFLKGKFLKSYISLRQAFIHKKAVTETLMTCVTWECGLGSISTVFQLPDQAFPSQRLNSGAPLPWSWGDRPQPGTEPTEHAVPNQEAGSAATLNSSARRPFTCRDPRRLRKPARPERLVQAAPSTSGVRKQPSPKLSGGPDLVGRSALPARPGAGGRKTSRTLISHPDCPELRP